MATETKPPIGNVTVEKISVGTPGYTPWSVPVIDAPAKFEEQEKRIAELEAGMKTLEARLEALEAKQQPAQAQAQEGPRMTASVFTRRKETVPPEVRERLRKGENPLRVYREHRGLTGRQLAENVGVSQAYISQLETDRRAGTTEVMKKIAAVLDVSLDRLV